MTECKTEIQIDSGLGLSYYARVCYIPQSGTKIFASVLIPRYNGNYSNHIIFTVSVKTINRKANAFQKLKVLSNEKLGRWKGVITVIDGYTFLVFTLYVKYHHNLSSPHNGNSNEMKTH